MRFLKASVLTAMFFATSLGLAYIGYPWFEPARLFYDVHGIDVSHHQGPIDWNVVAAGGVSFAYIKATEGGDFVDPQFERNWAAAAEAGVRRGAYHFFTRCRSGEVQAANFMANVKVDATALPPVVDAEHMGPCRKLKAVEDIAAELTDFSERIGRHYGKKPIIYTTREFHDRFLEGRFRDYRFWLRGLVVPPLYRSQPWTIWQYHNRGRRNGITGPVDLNVLRGGIPVLDAL